MNGHCEGTCVNTKLWSFSHAKTFLKRISFIIVEHGMDHIMEGWVTCLQTHDIFQMIWNPMMMMKMNMEQNDLPMGAIVGSNDTMNSSTPMERAFAQLVTIMQKITNECKEGDVTFCEHAISHMRVLACNIRNIHLIKANAILHPGLVLHHIENGLGNNVKRLKNRHETMFNHTNVHTK